MRVDRSFWPFWSVVDEQVTHGVLCELHCFGAPISLSLSLFQSYFFSLFVPSSLSLLLLLSVRTSVCVCMCSWF
jgi:hypothetical protein